MDRGSETQSETATLLESAGEAMANEEWTSALNVLMSAVSNDPENLLVQALATIASSHLQTDVPRTPQEVDREAALLHHAIKEVDRRSTQGKILNELTAQLGDLRDAALKESSKRTEAIRLRVETHLERARKFAGKGKILQSLIHLKRAGIIAPNYPPIEAMRKEAFKGADQSQHEPKNDAHAPSIPALADLLQRANSALERKDDREASIVIGVLCGIAPLNEEVLHCKEKGFTLHISLFTEAAVRCITPDPSLRARQVGAVVSYVSTEARPADASVETHLHQSQKYVEQSRFEDAIGEVCLALLLDPLGNPAERSRSAVTNAQHAELEALFVRYTMVLNRLWKTDRRDIENRLQEVRTLQSGHECDKALDALETVFAIDPNDEEALGLEQALLNDPGVNRTEVLTVPDEEQALNSIVKVLRNVLPPARTGWFRRPGELSKSA